MATYRFNWLDGTNEIGSGNSVSDAFMKLGYSQGAMSVLDYFEELEFEMTDVPQDLVSHIDPNECVVEKTTEEGIFVVLDHSIQQPIGYGNQAGCYYAITLAKEHGVFDSLGE